VIALQGVGKLLGKKELFQSVSFHVHPGDRIGLVGPNGAGKTSLFQLILGNLEPDQGAIARSKNLRMGYLPQQWVPSEDKTVLGYVMDVHEELKTVQESLQALQRDMEEEKDSRKIQEMALTQARLMERMENLGGYDLEPRARRILAGLGFRDDRLGRSMSTLSGGWVMRSALARLLLWEPDLLLLDEPTNHLDLESLLWLEDYLLNTSSALILIAHDRKFLNRVVRRILELERGALNEYSGTYDDYREEKARRQEIQRSAYKNQQDRIRQMERFIERNRYRKSTARRAQSRLKQLDKLEPVTSPDSEEETVRFVFPEPPRAGKRVLELKQAKKAYGDHVVYEGIDLVLERGDRIAFLGANGAGKSTLLKMLAGVVDCDGGRRVPGSQARIGYYAQYQWEQLNSQWTVLEEASSVSGDLPQSRLRGLLGAFLFKGEDVFKKVSVLSGGEKARLTLCKLLLQRPNVLLLDEPTNHLDIPSRDVLEKALAEFPGTIAFISHDRHFINGVASKTLLVEDGRIQLFPGSYDDFESTWKPRLSSGDSPPPSPEASVPRDDPPVSSGPKGQERKRLEAVWRNELYRIKKPLQKEVDRLESALDEAHRRLDDVDSLLADPETYRDGERARVLRQDRHRLQEDVRRLTEEWEEKALSLEELEESFWREKESSHSSAVAR